MPSWTDLQTWLNSIPPAQRGDRVQKRFVEELTRVSAARSNRHVILYGSAFLQKPLVPPPLTQITHDDLNGLMSAIHEMDVSRGLTLIIHTPGGVTNAAETIVQYIRSKFSQVEVIVPAIAMSAGTMIALSGDQIVMGRQSQIGPIDPQLPFAGRIVSAQAVVDQFTEAQKQIRGDLNLAHVWAPILASLGPSLLVEARQALDYGEEMVAGWLSSFMLAGNADSEKEGKRIAAYFNNVAAHKSHGRRIDRDEARKQGLVIEDLETAPDDLQDAVLTAYHLMTIAFDSSPAAKVITTDHGHTWLKNVNAPQIPPSRP